MLCTVASFTDIRRRRIPDLLTLPAMAIALVLAFAMRGTAGLFASLCGLVLGGGVLGIIALGGGMGGGDVKLMAAVSALLGFPLAVYAILYAALLGGVLAIAMAAFRADLWRALRNVGAWIRGVLHLSPDRPALGQGAPLYVPYGVAIAAGALWALARQWIPLLRIP